MMCYLAYVSTGNGDTSRLAYRDYDVAGKYVCGLVPSSDGTS